MKRGDQVQAKEDFKMGCLRVLTAGTWYVVNGVRGGGPDPVYLKILGDDDHGHHLHADLFEINNQCGLAAR